MKDYEAPRWGEGYSQPGWIAVPGASEYDHRFGGCSWSVSDRLGEPKPLLIVTLDCRDPRLSVLSARGVASLPICICVDSCFDVTDMSYLFDESTRVVSLISKVANRIDDQCEPIKDLLETEMRLRPMGVSEIPSNETSYYQACDGFVGGDALIRVLGSPLWLESVEKATCQCGREMHYVASIGYEGYEGRSFQESQPIFFGELVFYFFACLNCRIVSTITQST